MLVDQICAIIHLSGNSSMLLVTGCSTQFSEHTGGMGEGWYWHDGNLASLRPAVLFQSPTQYRTLTYLRRRDTDLWGLFVHGCVHVYEVQWGLVCWCVLTTVKMCDLYCSCSVFLRLLSLPGVYSLHLSFLHALLLMVLFASYLHTSAADAGKMLSFSLSCCYRNIKDNI